MSDKLDKAHTGRRFPYSRAAEILHLCDWQSIEAVAGATGVSKRTILRWKARLHEDPELYFYYQKFVQERVQHCCERLPAVVLAAIDWVGRACEAQDPSNPDSLKAMSIAIESLTEVLVILAAQKQALNSKIFPAPPVAIE